MYLHRYPHIQSIHPYINRLVHMDLHIPRQCMYPPEQFTALVAKSQSQLFSRHYNLRSPKSQMWGKSNYTNYYYVLMTASERSPVAVQKSCKPTWATLLGIMAVELDLTLFLPVMLALQGHYKAVAAV